MSQTEGKPEALRLAEFLDREAMFEGWLGSNEAQEFAAAADRLRSQHAEIEQLRALLARADRALDAMGNVTSNHCIAMQAAVIDGHLRSPSHGLQWIVNTLDGPGLLPDLDDAKAAGGAQAWFDRETAIEEERKRKVAADAGQADTGATR